MVDREKGRCYIDRGGRGRGAGRIRGRIWGRRRGCIFVAFARQIFP